MAYSVIFAGTAQRQFDKLPKPAQQRLGAVIAQLADNPRPSGVVKLSAEDRLYRVRDGDYRAIYRIEDNRLLVTLVEPEQDDKRALWAGLSLSGLAGAYGEDEPDYGPVDVRHQ